MSVLLLLACFARAAPPDANEAAILRRPRAMSLTLLELAPDADVGQRAQVAYYLGRCFEQIGLLQSAHRQYVRALASDAWRSRALSGLVRTAERIGDDEAIVPHVAAADPADFSEAFAGALWFLRGRHLAREGDVAGAEAALRQVAATSPRYPAAQLQLAVLHSDTGAPEAARDLLLHVLSLRAPRSQLARLRLRRTQQLARLDLARVYYGAHRYEEALRIYDTVDEDGPYAAQAAAESAWALLLLDRPDEARARLAPLDTLEAAQLWLHLDPAQVDVAALDAEHAALVAIQARHRGDPAGLWAAWFGAGASVEVPVPDAFFEAALRDTRLSGAALRLRQIAAEEALIADQAEEWQAVFAAPLQARLETDRAQLQEQAGRLLLAALAARQEIVTSLLHQHREVMR